MHLHNTEEVRHVQLLLCAPAHSPLLVVVFCAGERAEYPCGQLSFLVSYRCAVTTITFSFKELVHTSINIYIIILFLEDSVRSSFRLGLITRFAELKVLVKSFERHLRGAAHTPLALPYPFRTST